LWCGAVASNHLFEFEKVSLDGLLTGLNQRFVACRSLVGFGAMFAYLVLSDVKSQEVETTIALVFLQRVGDTGFAFLHV
jgi:hypothetical protein